MPADSTLVISVVAVQEGTEPEGLRQVGFGAIAPFAGCSGSADAGKQPSSSLEREAVILGYKNGAHVGPATARTGAPQVRSEPQTRPKSFRLRKPR